MTDPAQGTITASSFTIVNDHEVIWYLPSVFNGNSQENQLQIAGGVIQAVNGTTLAPYTENYTTDNVGPRIVSTSIAEGASLSPGNLSYVVTFSEPIDQSNLTDASFDLHGTYLNADYTPDSFSFDPTGTILTINYSNLPSDSYRLTLFSTEAVDNGLVTDPNGFQDLVGNALDGEPYGLVVTDNTGVDTSGNLLPGGAIDPHYTIVSSPDGTGPAAYVTLYGGIPEFSNGPASNWIAPAADQAFGFNSTGQYDYQTTLDLGAYDPTNALITGELAADDHLVDILVNGVSTGITAPNQFFGYSTYTIDGSFLHSGVNTLDFLVRNDQGSTGFRNEMTLTAPASGSTIPPNQSGNGSPGGNYYVDFGMSQGTTAFPVPLQPVNPLGSLVYQGSTSSVLVTPTDVDTFTLNLNPNQTITVIDTSKTLQGNVEVFDPNGNLIGEASASAAGGIVDLETVPVSIGGVYSIEVSGLNGTMGAVTTQVTLNAALQSTVSSYVPGLLETQVNSYNAFSSPGDPCARFRHRAFSADGGRELRPTGECPRSRRPSIRGPITTRGSIPARFTSRIMPTPATARSLLPRTSMIAPCS